MNRSTSKQPTRYCRSCWYPLDYCSNTSCPECGKSFDPSDHNTFAPPTPRLIRTLYLPGVPQFIYSVILIGVFFFIVTQIPSRRHENFSTWQWTWGRLGELLWLYVLLPSSGGLAALAAYRGKNFNVRFLSLLLLSTITCFCAWLGYEFWLQW